MWQNDTTRLMAVIFHCAHKRKITSVCKNEKAPPFRCTYSLCVFHFVFFLLFPHSEFRFRRRCDDFVICFFMCGSGWHFVWCASLCAHHILSIFFRFRRIFRVSHSLCVGVSCVYVHVRVRVFSIFLLETKRKKRFAKLRLKTRK